MHAIDPASLALIIPIILRAMRARGPQEVTKACTIIGSLFQLIADPRDIAPYMESIISSIKVSVIDMTPEVRGVASRALGSMVLGVGPEYGEQVMPWLIGCMQSEGSTVERSGGAQGLCEILVAIGEPRLTDVLMQLLPTSTNKSSNAREGLYWLLCFVPPAIGPEGFAPKIINTLPVLVQGFADDVDQIREVALRAGQVIVRQHGLSHTQHVMPSIQGGLESN